MNQNELTHVGVLGMKWGKRKKYSSTGLNSYIAKKKNEKVDKSFKAWKENSDKKNQAIEIGLKRNAAKINYESDTRNKQNKAEYKQLNKDYKKAISKNTTYRKGSIKEKVGKDMSRKYLSEAKKVYKLLQNDRTNTELQKKYNELMSKHDVERASARKAQEVAANRSQKKANFKRNMTKSVKALAVTATVSAGAFAVNKYLSEHDFSVNNKSVRLSGRDMANGAKILKFAKEAMKYF